MSWSITAHGRGDALIEDVKAKLESARKSCSHNPDEVKDIDNLETTVCDAIAANKNISYSLEASGSESKYGDPTSEHNQRYLRCELKTLFGGFKGELHVFLSQAEDGVDFKKVLPLDRNTTCDIHGAARGVKEGSIGEPGTWHWPPMGKPVVVDC